MMVMEAGGSGGGCWGSDSSARELVGLAIRWGWKVIHLHVCLVYSTMLLCNEAVDF